MRFFKFPQVNRSSLLVPSQVTKPQEVNGTNGSAASPVTEATKQADPSSDSEQDEAGDTDESLSSESEDGAVSDHRHGNHTSWEMVLTLTDDLCAAGSVHRDRTVLHCQFCGKRGHAHNFMRSKRFCSTSCARG